MKGKLKILMVFSEVAPFSKTGGLGDVGGALPKVLKDMGHDVRIITPQYQVVNERKYVLRDVIRLQNIDVALGSEILRVNVKSAFLPNTKVQVYFIDYKPFFFRKGLYTDPKNGRDYPDADKRFILFSKGVLETLHKLHWQPDIIHCNDWQTGLIPFFLKSVYQNNPFFAQTHSLFTVHNFAFQGNFDPKCLSWMGLDNGFVLQGSGLEMHNRCSFLKAGVMYSDIVTTVSEKYAHQVQNSGGFGMEKWLKTRRTHFFGIVNGVDHNIWNPEIDTFIPQPFSVNTLEGKSINRQALLDRFGLANDKSVPVVVMVGRLTEQKGLDLVRTALDRMLAANVYFLVLGTGEEPYHQFLKKAQKKYPKRIGISLAFDEALAHLMIAGGDMLLMPSKYEPCGLTQQYSLKYGTVPIVSAVGGLVDTVEPFRPKTQKGTGFVFTNPDVPSMLAVLKQAVQCFQDPKRWIKIQRNGMKKDLSWQSPAKRYVQLYNKCLMKKA